MGLASTAVQCGADITSSVGNVSLETELGSTGRTEIMAFLMNDRQ